MAQPMNCDLECGNQAVFVTTAIGTGDVIALCAYCVFPWAMAITHELPEGDELMRSAFVPEPAKPKRSRTKAHHPAPDGEPSDEPDDEPAQGEPATVGAE